MNLFLRRSSSAFIFCFVLAAHEIDYKSISHFEIMYIMKLHRIFVIEDGDEDDELAKDS